MSEIDPGALRALALAVRRNGRTDHDLFRSRALELAEAVVTLLAERDKDGEALTIAKTALDAAEAKLRDVMAERDTMTATRDEACRLLDNVIRELAEHEDDPSMLDGHRAMVAAFRSVGGG